MEMAAPQCLSFRPRDDELIDLFLHRKLAGQPPLAAACFIHEVDVYSAAPDQLVTGLTAAPGTGLGDTRVWYFFSPVRHCAGKRKARTVGGASADGGKGWWHSEAGQKTIEGSAAAGCFQKFSFKVKTASGVVKPGWLMVEYSIGGADLVLCKVYRSPRAAPSSSRVVSSSTTTAALSESFGCKKRKAEEEHPEAPPPCSARRQMADVEHDDTQSLERDLTSSLYHDGPGGELADDHHHAEEAPPPYSDRQQTTDKEVCWQQILEHDGAAIPLQHFEHGQMSVDDDMSALLSFDFNELDLFGGEPGDHHPAEEAPPTCGDQQQTMDKEEDDDVLLFAESVKSTLMPEYYHVPGGELDDHNPAEEAPQPCIDWQQTMDKEEDEDVVPFAESIKSTLPPDYHHGPGGEPDDHHPAEEAPQPCSAQRQMTDEEVLEMIKEMLDPDGAAIPQQPFELNEHDLMSIDGDTSALLSFEVNELDLFGAEPGAPPPCAPPAEPDPAGDTAVDLVQTTTTVHGPCLGDTTQVADAPFYKEGVQLDEPAPGEFISGLPCPQFDPSFIEEFISASGDVVMPWPAVPAAVTWLCGGDSLSPASLQTGNFGVSPRPAVC